MYGLSKERETLVGKIATLEEELRKERCEKSRSDEAHLLDVSIRPPYLCLFPSHFTIQSSSFFALPFVHACMRKKVADLPQVA